MFSKDNGMCNCSKSLWPKIFYLVLACAWISLAIHAASAAAPEKATPSKAASPEGKSKAATAKPRKADPRAVQILDSLGKRFQAVTTAHGKFDQIKRSQTFGQETKTRGEFWYAKPDKFRCDYSGKRDADELINLIVDNVAYVATPKFKQVERYPFDNPQATQRQLDRILLGFGIATEEILRSYDVSVVKEDKQAQQAWLRFIPRFEDNYGIDAIVLRLDLKNARPVDLVIEEGDDRTTLIIRDFDLNEKIDSKRFKVDFPKDWELIDKI